MFCVNNNPVERAIRPIALGRKNHLFADSDGGGIRWATICSLIATAKLNGVEPFAYLNDVLERMTNGHPMSRLNDLLPWNWTPSTEAGCVKSFPSLQRARPLWGWSNEREHSYIGKSRPLRRLSASAASTFWRWADEDPAKLKVAELMNAVRKTTSVHRE